jgi:SSS family solute:Na+ symporter
MMTSIIGLSLFAAAYSLYGGLSAVAWTDVIQVVLLVIGGFIMTYIGLQQITPDGGFFAGLEYLYQTVPEKFSMILSKGEIMIPVDIAGEETRDAWWDLPGISVLIGGMWVANLYYWGFNQYIIQRTLAAKSLRESQKGIVLAAALKMIIPLIVVIPGIIAFVMVDDNGQLLENIASNPNFASYSNADGNIVNDNATPWLIKNFIPVGVKGLVLAALAAAIVSSLASMLNSTSTIFTMDIYLPYMNKNATDKQTVNVGRITSAVALIIAVILAPQLGNVGQVFQVIQEYTGIVSPGILAVFLAGLFFRKATNSAAIKGALLSIPIAMYFKVGQNGWIDSAFFVTIPFMQQMLITCVSSLAIILILSQLEGKGANDPKGIPLTKELFRTSPKFNIGAFVVMLICAFLYAFFW